MLGFIVVLLFAFGGWYVSNSERWGTVWDVLTPILAGVLAMVALSLILRRLINARQQAIQQIMLDTQQQVNRQNELFMRRPPSSMNAAKEIMEKIQFAGLRKALAALDTLKPFYLWNFLLARQVNTMRLMLLFQLRDFKGVDKLLPKALLFDPQSLAIKLVRDYKNKDAGIDKFYRSKCSRMRGENAAFLASVYCWIKIHQDDVPTGLKALRDAAKSSDHPALLENINRLVNGKVKHYTNSGFGDNWYGLGLEEPKVKPQMRRY